MRDPEGFREAADFIEAAPLELRIRMANEQRAMDEQKEAFEKILENASPVDGDLMDTLLANLTIRPHHHPLSLSLVWMQCQPSKWNDHHPESCLDVAEMINSRQEV
jgi:hypothetical protein